jgi:hypothetical protein
MGKNMIINNDHFKFSMVKSGMRIVAYAIMILSGIPSMMIAGAVLILAEVIGIGEEMV